MEQQVLQLLQATTVPDTNTIKRAEQSLLDLHRQTEYPFALLHIATHAEIDAGSRKAALTALRNYVNLTWSPNFEEASAQRINLPQEARAQIRSQILAICTNPGPSNDANQNLAGELHDGVNRQLSQIGSSRLTLGSERRFQDCVGRFPERMARTLPTSRLCAQFADLRWRDTRCLACFV